MSNAIQPKIVQIAPPNGQWFLVDNTLEGKPAITKVVMWALLDNGETIGLIATQTPSENKGPGISTPPRLAPAGDGIYKHHIDLTKEEEAVYQQSLPAEKRLPVKP